MTKENILESAIRIMANHSFSNTPARMIAIEAGVSVGSIYNHYKSKEDILNYLFEQEYKKREQYLISLKESEKTNLDKLLAFVEFYFQELRLNENLSIVLIRESSNPDLAKLEGIKKFNDKLTKEFMEIIEKAINNEEIRKCNPVLVSNIIFNLIRGAVYTTALQNSGNLENMKDEVKIFIEKALIKDDI